MNCLYNEEGERYFAASNTKDGFVSYFDEIFSDSSCDRVFILKGGPGVGKSTFMKKLFKMSNDMGYSCELFHCSSDPLSLDGIIVKEKRVAVIDGTNPHSAEPVLAGAREIIVDLGKAWNIDKLYKNRSEISELSQKKKNCYSECYGFLHAKSVMDRLIYNLVFPHILFDKLEKSAQRLSNSLFKEHKGKKSAVRKIRITNAVSSLGKIRLFTFEKMAEYCIFIKEPYSNSRLAHFYMRSIYDTAIMNGIDTHVSFNPQNKGEIDAVYFPEIRTSISLYNEDFVAECDKNLKRCKIINCTRFIDSKAFSALKPLRKFYLKLSESMEKQALECLEKAGNVHMDTEKIYRQCTNYKTVEKIENEYFKMILQ